MNISSIWQGLRVQDKRNVYIALSLPIVALAAARTIKLLAFSRPKLPVSRSPREALQLLSGQQLDDVPYPPEALPGARDVDTPYGNIRVYEWGPETGRKVLFIHGISTPSIAFAGMAKLMVERGCRVMLFDLFGRGYSDAPDPEVYRQDIALWASQILLIVSTSKISWTGSERFSLVGYSLGGGISMAFVSYFPELVESLILIAPGGLLRPSRITRSSRILYGDFVPQFIGKYFIEQRLKGGAPPRTTPPKPKPGEESTAPPDVAAAEVPGHPAHARDSDAPLFPDRPKISIAKAVAWQVDAHPGFLDSFISSIKYSPISEEHERWGLVGKRCAARRVASESERMPGLNENRVLIIFGAQDQVIVADETGPDATEALGEENVKVLSIEGAHDVPVVNSRGCVDAITEFWEAGPT